MLNQVKSPSAAKLHNTGEQFGQLSSSVLLRQRRNTCKQMCCSQTCDIQKHTQQLVHCDTQQQVRPDQ